MMHIQQMKDEFSTGNNLFDTVAQSFSALESLWQSGTLSKPKLSAKLKNAIAFRIDQLNLCKNCVENPNRLEDAGTAVPSTDSKEQAIIHLVTKLITNGGYHAESEVETARQLGVSDLEVIRVVQMVSPMVFQAGGKKNEIPETVE